MSWPWKTCSPSSSIGLNNFSGLVSIGGIRHKLTWRIVWVFITWGNREGQNLFLRPRLWYRRM
jgi:hypothetical protein